MPDRHAQQPPDINGTDYFVALGLSMGALALYVRTLAPDILYGDSAEFQTLAYTLGMTHSTGYPVYLLLARLVGFLPIRSFAWRVNLVSALAAALAVAGVYLLARHLTPSRMGAALGAAALALSYTFWSQAIIAEVYTPGLAFLVVAVLLAWRWYRAPARRVPALFAAGLLVGLGLGVHASVGLIVPALAGLVLWAGWARPEARRVRRRAWAAAGLGLALGAGLLLLGFVLIELHNPPSSFVQVGLYPSRSIWGLQASDLDSVWERIFVTASGRQWQDVMFPGGVDFMWEEFIGYVDRLIGFEFSVGLVLLGLLGLWWAWRVDSGLGAFLVSGLLVVLLFILNYEPPDKYIFFLPTYVLWAVGIGAGAGFILDRVVGWFVAIRPRLLVILYPLAAALLVAVIAEPSGAARWKALQAGAGTFVGEDYAYPIYNLQEPRVRAQWWASTLPDDAMLLMDWRALYALYYVLHVEQGRGDITIKEAAPYGSQGRLADTLVQEVQEALQQGRAVFTDRIVGGVRENFRAQPALGGEWYQLSLR